MGVNRYQRKLPQLSLVSVGRFCGSEIAAQYRLLPRSSPYQTAAMMRRQSTKVAKATLLLAAVTLLLYRCTAFIAPTRHSSRRDFLGAMGTVAAVQAVGAPAAHAAIARWSGIYDDPKHPGCERSITKDGGDFVISGTSAADGNKACLEDAPTKKWYLIAQQGEASDELLVAPCCFTNEWVQSSKQTWHLKID
eukprot:s731_g16.t1